jgi:phosphohistidine phosphatase
MVLYLVQHGEANPETVDPARGLTPRGTNDVRRVAVQAGALNLPFKRILHSRKKRAAQTAEILAEYLMKDPELQQVEGLLPNDDPLPWVERLKGMSENTVLVGHLPNLARLSSALLCNDPDRPIISFHMAGIVCMTKSTAGWTVEWIMTPDTAS